MLNSEWEFMGEQCSIMSDYGIANYFCTMPSSYMQFGEAVFDQEGSSSPAQVHKFDEVAPAVSLSTRGQYAATGLHGDSDLPQQPPESPLLYSKFEQLPAPPNSSSLSLPRTFYHRPIVYSESAAAALNSTHMNQTESSGKRPTSSSMSSGYGSALSNAPKELKSKTLYAAEVLRDYNWISMSQGDKVVKVSGTN